MKPTIYVDQREKSVPSLLKKQAIVSIKQLDIADYVVSEEVGVERKTADDFLTSLMDGRLFEQMQRLKEAYSRPLLMLEGDPQYLGRVHENSIRGALSFIMLDLGIPVYCTRDALDTSKTLLTMAKREQFQNHKEVRTQTRKKTLSSKQNKLMLVESLPMVGPKNARNLLEYFGSIEKVINADVKELTKVAGIGKKRAEAIKRLCVEEYES